MPIFRLFTVLQGNEPNAHIETADDIQVETITCWNIKDLEVGQATDIKTDYSLYKINGNYEGVSYQYWAAKELTGKQIELTTSEVKTDEVGIFINNKTAIHGGSEIVRNEESSEIVEEEVQEQYRSREINMLGGSYRQTQARAQKPRSMI